MKKLNFTHVLVLALFLPFMSQAAVNVSSIAPTAETAENWIQQLSVEEFLDMSPGDIKARTGKKMNFREKMAFRMARHRVKKAQKRGENLSMAAAYDDASGDFNLGGFLLGFLLGPIGVLLSLLFGKGAFRSSLIGLLCAIIVGLIGWIIF
ncbi:MAG: hypothetical protein GYB31_09285 [Bacteroidetes bacterium]|nr:hypothetical protein [Bacteroidota bacterium]